MSQENVEWPLVHWSIGPLVHWSIGPLVHWSIGPLIHCSIIQLFHWYVAPLVHCSIGPLVHWTIGPFHHWSIGSSFEYQISKVNKVKLLSERTSGHSFFYTRPNTLNSLQVWYKCSPIKVQCTEEICSNIQVFIAPPFP